MPSKIMCPACAKNIERWATRCPYCHIALDPWTGWRALTKQTQRAAYVAAPHNPQPLAGNAGGRQAGGAASDNALELLRMLRNQGRLTREEFLVLKRGLK
jgi:hypothetical protein